MRVQWSLIGLMLLAACGHQSPEQIFFNAHGLFERLEFRYENILSADSDQERLDAIRLYASGRSLSFGSGMWESFCGNDYLICSEGAPLHKGAFLCEQDIQDIDATLSKLERYGYFDRPLYKQLQKMRGKILTVVRFVKGVKAYVEESQFIEDRRLKKAQLAHEQEQTRLLREMRDDAREKQYKKQRRDTPVTIESYHITVH